MQLDRVISMAPPRLGASIFHLFKTLDTKNLKLARICRQTWHNLRAGVCYPFMEKASQTQDHEKALEQSHTESFCKYT